MTEGRGIPRRWHRGKALFAVLLVLGCGPEMEPETAAELARLSNLGKAHLENREAAKAVETFSEAVALAPECAPCWRNLGRAHLLARDGEAALEALERAAEIEEGSAATAYLTGLAHTRRGAGEEAVRAFERAVDLDPDSATLRYQLAAAYQTAGRHPEAQEQLRETVRLDPRHATACYRLARYAASDGRSEDYERWNREFQRLREHQGGAARTADDLEVSAYTPAEPMAGVAEARPEPPPAVPVRFVDATADALGALAGAPAAAADVLDVAPEGAYTLAVAAADGALSVLEWRDGRFAPLPLEGANAPPLEVRHCLAADYHDDAPAGERFDPETQALRDLLLLGPDGARLWRRTGPRSFRDATGEAGLAGLAGDAARWVDVEHDGDLDLVVGTSAGLELWRNLGDGTFRGEGPADGLDVAEPVLDLAAADLEGDVAVDLAVVRAGAPALVLRSERQGRFVRRPEPPGPWPEASRVLLDDLDNDGRVDAALVGPEAVVILPGAGGEGPRLDLGGLEPRAAALSDFDNDGWLDLWVGGEASGGGAALRLWRNGGPAGWAPGPEAALDGPAASAVLDLEPADFDGDGDSDLLAVTAAGLRFLRNDGGDARRQLKVRLVGSKTNVDGLGTDVEVVRGDFRVHRVVADLPLEIGVGDRESVDALRTVWTNGVVDNQIDVPVEPVTVVEKNVATGSCPFLYAWDGRGMRFVTDLLGNSPVGLPISRGRDLPADPEELVRVGDGSALAPRDGLYRLRVTSEFREVAYLDQVELVAVDHPPELEAQPTDKLMPPPFPPSEVWLLGDRVPLRRAGSGGADRTADLREIDGRFTPPGTPLPPPFRGMTRPTSLVLDFGPLDPGRPWVLALTGWLQYGDASTNIALSQHPGLEPIPPRLEVEAGPGRWLPVPVTVGMPAGKTKTILTSLDGLLPEGAGRLRLTTTHEIRWDRAALFERVPGDVAAVHRLAPAAADLSFFGFSELAARRPGHPTTPDPRRVSSRPPWRTALQGWSTRYGGVGELVEARDGRLAIVNSGDALDLGFAADSLPPVPGGWRRTFFVRSVGWDKDGDHNVAGGDRVEPLPGAVDGPWRARYNTRWVPRDRFRPGADRAP